jgi:hypothetical protein
MAMRRIVLRQLDFCGENTEVLILGTCSQLDMSLVEERTGSRFKTPSLRAR